MKLIVYFQKETSVEDIVLLAKALEQNKITGSVALVFDEDIEKTTYSDLCNIDYDALTEANT